VNSEWIPGKYPPLRFNEPNHSNYNKNSTFWLTNVRYLRLKTIELGYTLPKELSSRIGIQTARFYINGFNLLSLDNVRELGIEPEIIDANGLQYPQHKRMNIGVNVSF